MQTRPVPAALHVCGGILLAAKTVECPLALRGRRRYADLPIQGRNGDDPMQIPDPPRAGMVERCGQRLIMLRGVFETGFGDGYYPVLRMDCAGRSCGILIDMSDALDPGELEEKQRLGHSEQDPKASD